jgi:hypothetical protein
LYCKQALACPYLLYSLPGRDARAGLQGFLHGLKYAYYLHALPRRAQRWFAPVSTKVHGKGVGGRHVGAAVHHCLYAVLEHQLGYYNIGNLGARHLSFQTEVYYTFPSYSPRSKTIIVLKNTKEDSGSDRNVYLPAAVYDKLMHLRQMQEKVKEEYGSDCYFDHGMMILEMSTYACPKVIK